jgi:hypothetical protein
MSQPPPVYADYTQPAYPPYDPFAADRSYLKTLSILHYVWGGIALFFSCFAIIYIGFGIAMLNGAFNFPPPPPPQQFNAGQANSPRSNVTWTTHARAGSGQTGTVYTTGGVTNAPRPGTPMAPNQPPPPAIGWLLIGIGSLVLLFGWTIGLMSIISGRRITARRSRVFSMVVAGINCISFPLGTALGVFTIIVLSKATVKTMYEQA